MVDQVLNRPLHQLSTIAARLGMRLVDKLTGFVGSESARTVLGTKKNVRAAQQGERGGARSVIPVPLVNSVN